MTDRIVFLHGFTQTHHHWHAVAFDLASRVDPTPTLTFVDLPGHGLNGGDRTTIAEAGRVAEAGGRGTYVGYSMGGRFALVAALERPDLVERLVLIGATAGIDDEDERADRRRTDHDRADRLERIGVDAFIDEWMAAPMFDGLPDDPDGREHRRRNGVAGLAHSLRTCGTGAQTSYWARLPELVTPTLLIVGARDRKFTEIGQRMAVAMPDASFVPVPEAGHAAHTEAPGATTTVIASWMTGHASV